MLRITKNTELDLMEFMADGPTPIKPIFKWESSEPQVDDQGRPLYGYSVVMFSGTDRSFKARVVSGCKVDQNIVGGKPIRVIGLGLHISAGRDGGAKFVFEAERIESAIQAPTKSSL